MPSNTLSAIVLVALESWHMLARLWCFIALGIVAGSLASAFIPAERLSGFLSARAGSLLPVSAAAGMASPLCTYGTVPFFLGMLERGMPVGPVATFLVASAAVNPQIVMLTAGALGIRMAAVQIAAVFVMAIAVGRLVSAREDIVIAAVRRKAGEPPHAAAPHGIHHRHHKADGSWKAFVHNTMGIAEHVLLYFVLGILAANAVGVLTSGSFFSGVLGAGHWFAVPLAGVLSLPLYVCGGAAIPMLAVGGGLGMNQGAVLAFLIAGPATRIAPLVGMGTIFTKRALVLYVAFIICFAIASGLAYDALLRVL